MTFGLQKARPNRTPLAVSLAIHAAAFYIAIGVPTVTLPHASESEYKQKISGKEPKLVWYKFRKELPAVTPPKTREMPKPLRAEVEAKQAIVSAPENAPKRTQMVWTPAPLAAPVPLPDSPNLLAISKVFVAPPAVIAKSQPIPEAPQLPAQLAATPALQLAPKPYLPPALKVPSATRKVVEATGAPQLEASLTPVKRVEFGAAKLPPRSIFPADAPPVDLPVNSQGLNVAIVGLNPSDKAAVLPPAPSPGAFSAGPVVRKDGASSEGTAQGLSVPDLFVRGPQAKKIDLLAQAYAAPTSELTLRAAMRGGEPVAAPPVVRTSPQGTKVSGAPDPRFNGRDVYMMAIQMANLTSDSGSWLMWYADRTARETGLAPLAAPTPKRKVDPKYIATAVEERVEGRVQLACVIDKEGNVSTIELLRGVDDRLNQSAKDALAKWLFFPATRNGEPVDVDVLVEIPFRLAPRLPGRR